MIRSPAPCGVLSPSHSSSRFAGDHGEPGRSILVSLAGQRGPQVLDLEAGTSQDGGDRSRIVGALPEPVGRDVVVKHEYRSQRT